MRILITGGAGFLGARLAREILKRGQLNGRSITELVIADLFSAPADVLADSRVTSHTGPLLAQGECFKSRFDGVFHLASAVSGECELDFDLGLRSNLDSSRFLLDCMRAACTASGKAAKFVFASSVTVFGPTTSNPLPDLVSDTTLPTPQTSYGTHKLMTEHLVADYTRKGYIDGRCARLMTVTIRPGKPNGAASSFFSAIIREPLAGLTATCPVDPDTSHPVSSPGNTIQGLITLFEADQETLGGRMALNLPSLNVKVIDMLAALEKVAGPTVRARVQFERDERICAIVDNWAKGATASRANALGLQADDSFESIIQQYIEDCKTRPGYPAQALNGLQ